MSLTKRSLCRLSLQQFLNRYLVAIWGLRFGVWGLGLKFEVQGVGIKIRWCAWADEGLTKN